MQSGAGQSDTEMMDTMHAIWPGSSNALNQGGVTWGRPPCRVSLRRPGADLSSGRNDMW